MHSTAIPRFGFGFLRAIRQNFLTQQVRRIAKMHEVVDAVKMREVVHISPT